MAGGGREAFPKLVIEHEPSPLSTDSDTKIALPATRRRKSSALGGEIRAGDTAPAIATFDAVVPPSPTISKSTDDHKKSGRKRRKARSLARRWKRYALKHTWVTPLVFIFIFLALFAINPTESNPIHHFLFLSYKIEPQPGSLPDAKVMYGKGRWDIAFVAFYTIVLSFTREFIMQLVLRPLARNNGLRTRGKQSRFMEQAYTAFYFAFLGPVGLWIMKDTPLWYFNTRAMYEGFPHKLHEAPFKFYYLFQGAYWLQQAIVLLLGMEKPRKDYKELVGHHVVTLALIGLSYRFHFTYMGIAVYITHDISDFFLAVSKTLNYIDRLPTLFFATFMGMWIYLRHYLNIQILISILTQFRFIGPYELNWETEQYKCWISFYISLSLLSCLQILNLFWLYYIIRIAWRFLTTNVQQDDRSDDDDELEETEELLEQEKMNGHPPQPALAVNGNVVLNGHATGVSANGNGAVKRETRSRK